MKKKNKENKEIDKTPEVRVMKTIKRVKTTKLAIAFLALILLIVAPTTVEAKTKSYMKFDCGNKLTMYEGESIEAAAECTALTAIFHQIQGIIIIADDGVSTAFAHSAKCDIWFIYG